MDGLYALAANRPLVYSMWVTFEAVSFGCPPVAANALENDQGVCIYMATGFE